MYVPDMLFGTGTFTDADLPDTAKEAVIELECRCLRRFLASLGGRS